MVAVLATAALIGGGGRYGERSTGVARSDDGASGAGMGAASGQTEATVVEGGDPAFDEQSPPTTFAASATDGDRELDSTESGGGGIEDRGTLATSSIDLAGAPADAKIIRTGNLQVQVADGTFDAATVRLSTIATNAGGFVSASETSALDDEPRGSLTLRVPADQFDAVVGEVGKVGDVLAVNTNSQDVTGEYTDVASRLKALQAERDQINLVLGRAENIPDILSVRDRLAIVQGEIETLQGRQKVLDDQTSLSTLTVSLSEEGDEAAAATSPVERSGFSRLWHDSADRFTDGARSIALGLASMAPWLLLALVLFVPGRAIWRRTAPAEARPATPTGPPPTTTAAD
ncbi:MAG: DUF4349 domain-containing protein [Actinomycetota bacterium]|nr:DUF4349 domain-containing protein [Actinomycetota bacterium]